MSSRSSPETLSPREQHGQPDCTLPSSCLYLLPAVCFTTVGRLGLQKHHPGSPWLAESPASMSAWPELILLITLEIMCK